MSFYRKIPVLDEQEQLEFDKYLEEQYARDFQLAREILLRYWALKMRITDPDYSPKPSDPDMIAVFDKLATPRIYLLQAWIHQKAQQAAGVEK